MEKRSIHPFLAFLDDTEMISRVTDLVREKVRPFEGVAYCCVPVVTRHDLQEGKKNKGKKRGKTRRFAAVVQICQPQCIPVVQRHGREDVSTHGETQSRYLSLSFSLSFPFSFSISLAGSLGLIPLKSQPRSLLMRSRRNQDNYFSEATIFCSLFCNKQKHEVKADVSFVLDMQLKQGNSRDV